MKAEWWWRAGIGAVLRVRQGHHASHRCVIGWQRKRREDREPGSRLQARLGLDCSVLAVQCSAMLAGLLWSMAGRGARGRTRALFVEAGIENVLGKATQTRPMLVSWATTQRGGRNKEFPRKEPLATPKNGKLLSTCLHLHLRLPTHPSDECQSMHLQIPAFG